MTAPIVLWLRDDLRTGDHPALHAAVSSGKPVLPLFILDDAAAGAWRAGGAARWWLHHALEALEMPVLRREGDSATILDEVIEATGADTVFWTRRYEPFAIGQDRKIKADLKARGIRVASFPGRTLFEPFGIRQKNGGPYKVFTPYFRQWQSGLGHLVCLPRPDATRWSDHGLDNDDLRLLPTAPDWAGGLRESWRVSEEAARERLDAFVEEALDSYAKDRDFPAIAGVSRLSPFLHAGLISPRQIVARLQMVEDERTFAYLRQIAWRDFAAHCLFHNPAMPETSLRAGFEAFPWRDDAERLRAWQEGRTGFPVVDAGMRELWQTGYMHNRVRMLTGSFLTKNLMIHWRSGLEWFHDTLVDADLANNSMGWQWVAGSGIDAAPYFRIFNPTVQGERFDPNGDYVRRFVPELARLPAEWIHKPADAPADVLDRADVRLGASYPSPIVDHATARNRALEAFRNMKAS